MFHFYCSPVQMLADCSRREKVIWFLPTAGPNDAEPIKFGALRV